MPLSPVVHLLSKLFPATAFPLVGWLGLISRAVCSPSTGRTCAILQVLSAVFSNVLQHPKPIKAAVVSCDSSSHGDAHMVQQYMTSLGETTDTTGVLYE